MDQRFKSTMDLETAWDRDWKHTVAKKRKKKGSDNYFHKTVHHLLQDLPLFEPFFNFL